MSTSNPNSMAVAEIKKDISKQVLDKIDAFQKSGELSLPKDYNVENALKSAYIILSNPKDNILAKCDKSSVAEALLKMVVYGVSPIKKQCYFIPYGDKLECNVSYAGNIAIAKRYGNMKAIKGNVIYEGDDFEFEIDTKTGRRKLVKHMQTLESVGNDNIKGAYAIVEMEDGSTDMEVMTLAQIKAAWNQGATKGNSPAHQKFPDQMAIKTVINRACKLIISSSDDSILYDPLEEKTIDVVHEDVEHEIKTQANKQPLSFENNAEEAEVIYEVVSPEQQIDLNAEVAQPEIKF